MKVLIAGGTGFIGKQIGKALARKNHDIVIISRKSDEVKKDLPFPCQVIKDSEVQQLGSVDAVINLTGESVAQKWTEEVKTKIRNSRIQTTENLIKNLSLLTQKPKVYVGASAIGFYGDRGDDEIAEDFKKGEGFLSDITEEWEYTHGKAADLLNARIVMLRIGIVLGNQGGALESMLTPFKLGVGGGVGSGKQWMSWVHIDDLANLFVWALENENSKGVYNAVAPQPVKNQEFSQVLAAVMRTRLVANVPAFILKTKFGEMASIILGSTKVFPKRLENEGFKFSYVDLSNALENLLKGISSLEELYIYEQWVPQKIDTVFEFFKDENNLQSITPPWLDFKVLNKSTPTIQKGTLINYNLKLYGVPMSWQTLIEDWKPNQFFIDTQLKGPYKKWHHTHEFEELKGGTLIRDIVKFILPVGILGYFGGGWKAKGDVKKIFEYRKNIVDQLFKK